MTVEAGGPEIRARAAVLMRTTGRTATSIGRELGVNPNTLSTWNNRYHWRLPAYARRRLLAPANWPEARRAAVARLHANPFVDVGDLAVAMGGTRDAARALFAAAGLSDRTLTAVFAPPDPGGLAPDPRLRAALRGHIARQIARFDAALQGDAPSGLDTARVLRDLGGLKRLLDETDDGQGAGDGAGLSQADRTRADDHNLDLDLDLPALRAQIARRYAAFAGEREDAGLPGEPAAGADPGARP